VSGAKTNEGATAVGEQVGTRAVAKYIRGSATKARQVLDLIRGLDVQRADDVLRYTEREMATTIRKVLASAVANAEHNDSQGRDELYVAACFADEGPTLRRFRPRARGRATRIRKRTCHITIIVARLSEEELERKRRREEAQRPTARRGRGAAATASRRARVAKSRQAAAKAAAPASAPEPEELEETTVEDTEIPGAEVDEVEEAQVVDETEEPEVVDEAEEATEDGTDADEAAPSDEGTEPSANAREKDEA
jgi:large subunit ribosomal protein L22